MRELKSAKTLGADERRPFSERTERRLERMGDTPEGTTEERAADRSEAERVGFSVQVVSGEGRVATYG